MQFTKTDHRNVVRENFFKDLRDKLCIVNLFRLIESYNESLRVSREKSRGCMEKRRAYFFHAITLSFLL